MTNQTLLECPFDGCEDELQNRNGMAGCPTHTIMLNHADWNFRRAAAPAVGGDEHRANVACEIGACPMFQCRCSAAVIVAIKSRAAAAEERADKLQATVAALVEAGKAFVEAWDKSHQLEKTDVALRMMRTALAAVKGK